MSGGDPSMAALLRAAGLDPTSWSNTANHRYAAHRHEYDKVLVVTDGSIVFEVGEASERVTLGSGDRLDLPARTTHSAIVGPTGVTCLEAHVAMGSLGSQARRRAGWAIRPGEWPPAIPTHQEPARPRSS